MKTIFAIVLGFLICACSGDSQPTGVNPEDIAIVPPASHIPIPPPAFVNPKGPKDVLMDGSVADMDEFQASPWIGNCTASLVGPRALVTAAHCVGGSVSFSHRGDSYRGDCRIAKEYADGNHTADWAACKLSKDVTGVNYWEVINLDEGYIRVGDEVLLSGYGCLRWGGGIDGKYRVGKAEARSVPSNRDFDIVTRNGSTLCSGDSGGPAWGLRPDGKRGKQISVNSRSNTSDTSYLSAWGSTSGKRFLAAWQTIAGVKICGTSDEPANCLNGGPSTPPPPQKDSYFLLEHELVRVFAHMVAGKEDQLTRVKEALERALKSL